MTSKLIVFNHVSLDGYFLDRSGDMRWAYREAKDKEWDEFVAGNVSGGGVLLFGRVTYEMMASYWPTPLAVQNLPAIAERMNKGEKVVFSRKMEKASWSNTILAKGDLVMEVRKMKENPAPAWPSSEAAVLWPNLRQKD